MGKNFTEQQYADLIANGRNKPKGRLVMPSLASQLNGDIPAIKPPEDAPKVGHTTKEHAGRTEKVAKPSKYYNIKDKASDGTLCRSKKEARRLSELLLMEKAGKISNLTREVPYVLIPSVVMNGRKKPAIRYFADFVYVENGIQITEDCKGMRTQIYRIKKHMMKYVHGIDIRET